MSGDLANAWDGSGGNGFPDPSGNPLVDLGIIRIVNDWSCNGPGCSFPTQNNVDFDGAGVLEFFVFGEFQKLGTTERLHVNFSNFAVPEPNSFHLGLPVLLSFLAGVRKRI